MPRRFSKELLHRIRNEVDIRKVVQALALPWKVSEGYFRFLCPRCSEFNTATNPRTNLGRCFRCRRNFNPIDLVMVARASRFLDSVEFLSLLLAPAPTDSPGNPALGHCPSKNQTRQPTRNST